MKSSAKKKRKLTESGTLNTNADEITDPLFKSSDFFDVNDLLQVKYEMLRQVEKEDRSVTDVAKGFGFSRRHFYILQKKFADEGLQGLLPEKRGPKGAHKLTDEIMNFINTQVEENPLLKVPGISLALEKRFGITAHRRSIERALDRKKKAVKS